MFKFLIYAIFIIGLPLVGLYVGYKYPKEVIHYRDYTYNMIKVVIK